MDRLIFLLFWKEDKNFSIVIDFKALINKVVKLTNKVFGFRSKLTSVDFKLEAFFHYFIGLLIALFVHVKVLFQINFVVKSRTIECHCRNIVN